MENETLDAVEKFIVDKERPTKENKHEAPKGWVNGLTLYNRGTTSYSYLVNNLFLKTGISTIYGVEDTGKSQLALSLLLSVIGEETFLGKKINTEHKRGLLISTEDAEEDIEVRLHMMVDNSEYLEDNLKRLDTRYTAKDPVKTLSDYLEKTKVDLVVLDCFGDMFPHDMKQLNHTRVWLQEFYELTTQYKFHLLFVHHSKKGSEAYKPHASNCSGVGLTAKGRTSIEFRKDPEDIDKRHVCIVKANHLKEELKQDSIEVKFNHGFFKVSGSKQFDMLVITDEEKSRLMEKIVVLNATKTQAVIAEELGINQSQVSRYLKKAKHDEKYS